MIREGPLLAEDCLLDRISQRLLLGNRQRSGHFVWLHAFDRLLLIDTAKDQRHGPHLLEQSEDGKVIHHLT